MKKIPCPLPWVNFFLGYGGEVKVCCWSKIAQGIRESYFEITKISLGVLLHHYSQHCYSYL